MRKNRRLGNAVMAVAALLFAAAGLSFTRAAPSVLEPTASGSVADPEGVAATGTPLSHAKSAASGAIATPYVKSVATLDAKKVGSAERDETKTDVGASSPSPVKKAEGAKKASISKKDSGPPIGEKTANLVADDKDFETYLDRLMAAESGGRLEAKNPRSSALGPYQFIRSTFLAVAKRYFADEVKGLSDAKILALRTDLQFSRKAAAAYTKENAAYLAAEGLKTTYGNLRMAFLLGPSGAAKILSASPDAHISSILGRGVLRANRFMIAMTAGELSARCNREISIDPSRVLATTGLPKVRRGPRIRVRCNLSRPSCKRWLALKRKQLKGGSKRRAGKRTAQKRR